MPMGATVVNAGTSEKYLYVTNYQDGSISSYSLNTGTPVSLATTSTGSSGPLCIMADPSLQRYLYVADYTGNHIGGLELDPATGGLITNQNQPYPTSGQPTCVAAVKHAGNANGLH
jgi:6-phosphogluconolactonase (cycloisomerase 2 family)